jgi:hypothetical protein
MSSHTVRGLEQLRPTQSMSATRLDHWRDMIGARAHGGRTETRRPASPEGRLDLAGTVDFLIVDVGGRPVGWVEAPMYGASLETPDAVAVRFGFLRLRRRLVPAAAIQEIDDRTQVIGLRVDRAAIRTFL